MNAAAASGKGQRVDLFKCFLIPHCHGPGGLMEVTGDQCTALTSIQQAGAFIKRLHLLRLTRPPAKSNRLSIIY